MATKIELTVNIGTGEETYTLEYNRNAVKNMEARGFSIKTMDDKLATQMDIMLQGALEMHHGTLNNTVRQLVMNAIYKDYDAMELYSQLLNMVVETVPVLRDSNPQVKSGKKTFTVIT